MTTYRTGNHWGVTIVREYDHIEVPGVEGGLPRSELVAVVVNGDRELAQRICTLLNDQARDTGPVHLPWSYWDGVVETELRVDEYPYGGGIAGSGVQITLGQRRDGQIIAVRLPRESARRLALAILGSPEPAAAELGLDEEAPASRLSAPLSASQPQTQGAPRAEDAETISARCRKCGWDLDACTNCGEPALCGEPWCAQCQPESGWTDR